MSKEDRERIKREIKRLWDAMPGIEVKPTLILAEAMVELAEEMDYLTATTQNLRNTIASRR